MRANTISSILGRLILMENGCAIWPGQQTHNGYAQVAYRGRKRYVHRLLYEHFVGPVPAGKELDHVVCQVRHCANFAHLEPVTHTENVRRGTSPSAQCARQTHCIHGHELSPENLASWEKGRRRCLTCERHRCRIKSAAQHARERANRPPGDPRRSRYLTVQGERLRLAEWSRRFGVPASLIATRIDRLGWSVEAAVTTPIDPIGGRYKPGWNHSPGSS